MGIYEKISNIYIKLVWFLPEWALRTNKNNNIVKASLDGKTITNKIKRLVSNYVLDIDIIRGNNLKIVTSNNTYKIDIPKEKYIADGQEHDIVFSCMHLY